MIFSAPFPLLTLWVRDLGISRAQAGALTGLWYLVSACASLPAGWLADRVRLRRLFLSLWALIVAGTALMAGASGFWMLCLGRVISSAGLTGHLVAGPKLLAAWFEGRKEFGLIMGCQFLPHPRVRIRVGRFWPLCRPAAKWLLGC